MQDVILEYGMEGYGLYWYCVELIAANVTPDNITFELEHDARVIARNTALGVQKVEEMMSHFVKLGLFENSQGLISCLKLAQRTDDYIAKLVRNSRLQLTDNSGVEKNPENSDKIPKSPPRRDKNRSDQNRSEENKTDAGGDRHLPPFERFFRAYPKQTKKPLCQDIWNGKKLDPLIAIILDNIEQRKARDVAWEKGYISQPHNYLRNEEWNDAIEERISSSPGIDPTDEKAVNALGKELGITAKPGETLRAYYNRLMAAKNSNGKS